MDHESEIAALKKELQELRILLEQERLKNQSESKLQPFSKQNEFIVKPNITNDIPNLIDGNNADLSIMQSSLETNFMYHTQATTSRGKWVLRRRQLLSRAVPAVGDNLVALKTRETWQWMGRTVILDKITKHSIPSKQENIIDNDKGQHTETQDICRKHLMNQSINCNSTNITEEAPK